MEDYSIGELLKQLNESAEKSFESFPTPFVEEVGSCYGRVKQALKVQCPPISLAVRSFRMPALLTSLFPFGEF